jgi:peptide/nickel transport system substrate-binding protein
MLLLVGGIVWGLASAMADSSSPSPAAADGGKVTLKIGWVDEPDNLNPMIGYTMEAYTVWYLNYEPLVGVNPTTLAPDADYGIAESWTDVNGDGKTWEFKIRQGDTWQDGEPVTAADVAFTYNYVIDNDLYNWTSYTTNIDKAEVVDDYTVRIICSEPKPAVIQNYMLIYPEHIWSKISGKEAENSFQNKPPIIGSGPFQCTEWKKGEYVRMEAYKDFWRGAPKVDELIFQYFTNPDSLAAEFKAGSVDAASGLLGEQIKAIAADTGDGLEAEGVQINGYDEIGFNCYTGGPSKGNPVLTDAKFRYALGWAVDKQKLVDIAYQGMASPGDTVICGNYFSDPDWHWTPTEDVAYTFDLEKAKQLLDEAGYTDSDGNGIRENKGKDIKLRLWSRAESKESQQVMKLFAGWLKEIGIDSELQTMDEGSMTEKMYATNAAGEFEPDYDVFHWGWYNDTDPGIGLDYFTTNQINGWSDCAWSDPAYDKLQVEQGKEIDVQKRLDIIYEQQKMLYTQAPYIVIAYSADTEGWNTAKWDGWVRSPEPNGNMVIPPYGYETLYQVHPKTAGSESDDGGSNTTMWVIIGVVAAVVVIVLIVLLTRKKPQAMEE